MYGLKSAQSLPWCARASALAKSFNDVTGIFGVEASHGRDPNCWSVRCDRGGKGRFRLANSAMILGNGRWYLGGGL